MTFQEMAVRLGLEEIEEPFERGWEESDRSYPGLEKLFLREAFIREQAALVSLDEVTVEELSAAAARARREPALARLLWHEHRLYCGLGVGDSSGGMIRTPPPRGGRRGPVTRLHRNYASGRPRVPFLDDEHDPSGFPDLSPAIGKDALALNLLLALSALPNVLEFYNRRHIPEPVRRETLSDFALWVRYYREHLGSSGITAGTLSWLRFHLRGRLFRLGRLQFKHGSFPRDLTVYRSIRTGEVRVLAAAGLTVDGRGLLLFGPQESAGEEVWTTRRRAGESALLGNPIDPSGVVKREDVRLPFEEYLPVLQERTPILEVHIPEGEPMTPELCAESFAGAAYFFPEYFPERRFEGFTCESWFLGRELLDLLSPGSNLRSFADELYLYPCMGREDDAVARVFGLPALETENAAWPRETSLQRAVAERLRSGAPLRPGGGFFLAVDLPWGHGVYRGHGPEPPPV